MGKMLRVDLGTKEFRTEEIKSEDEETYIGGAGVAAAILIREVAADVDPYDAQNLLIFSVGPFCGTQVPFCGRHFVTAKSPLTGILGESSAGGFFGKELRSTGFDLIIISGKSEEPVYLLIQDGNVEIRPAIDFWGKGTQETEAILKKEFGNEQLKIASIGQAGENLVKYAAIISELSHAAGRCGMGAVMGSKKLKAVVVQGTGKVSIHDKVALKSAVDKLHELTKASFFAGVMKTSGTPLHLDTMVTVGDLPIKNYTLERWRGTSKLGANAIKARGELKPHACFNCTVACKHLINYEGKWVARPEYETLAMLGTDVLVDDLESLIKWNLLVNDLGMDTISLGVCIACLLEVADRNLMELPLSDLGFTLDPENPEKYIIWGAKNAIETLIRMTASREGIGNDLAEGLRSFCKKYNLPAELAMHGKGLEVPAHEPRASNLTALDYATTPRGAYHSYEPMLVSFNMNLKKDLGITGELDRYGIDEAVDVVKKIQDAAEAYSAAGGCIFGFWFLDEMTPWVEALNAITGRSYTLDAWMQVGERLFNLKRAYSMKCGVTKADDAFGTRFYTPFTKGGARDKIPPLEQLLSKYYQLRGWDSEGQPSL